MSLDAQESVSLTFPVSEATPILRIFRLPSKKVARPAELWAAAETVQVDRSTVVFEVTEGAEYRFEWSGVSDSRCVTEPEELFEPDDVTGRAGRLRPKLSTGTVDGCLRLLSGSQLQFSFEVRSKKLDYKTEYRWMLRDVADHMTELVMHRFASARAAFEIDERRDAETLYEQFEFLRATLQGDNLSRAFAHIVQKPDTNWEESSELTPASQGLKAGAASAKQLGRGGCRRIPISHLAGLSSIPERVLSPQTDQTTNTVPNRFVLYALEHWQGVLWQLSDALSKKKDSIIVLRARREIHCVIGELEEMLRAPLFNAVGRRVRDRYLEPPPTASVLLGFVRSHKHWEWIRRVRTYNVRTLPRVGGILRDSSLLQSQLLLLYCPDDGGVELVRIVGEAELVSADEMKAAGYPEPHGAYWCVEISTLNHDEWTAHLSAAALDELVLGISDTRGTPTVVTWSIIAGLSSK